MDARELEISLKYYQNDRQQKIKDLRKMREKPKPFGKKGKFWKLKGSLSRSPYKQGEREAMLWPYREIKRALLDARICRILHAKLTQRELDRFVMKPMHEQNDPFMRDDLTPLYYDRHMVERGSFWVGGSLDCTGASPKPIKVLPLP